MGLRRSLLSIWTPRGEIREREEERNFIKSEEPYTSGMGSREQLSVKPGSLEVVMMGRNLMERKGERGGM